MKKLILFAAIAASIFSVGAQSLDEQVLLTVNGEPSTVGEFLYIYNKNKQESAVTAQSLNEYLEMFINFKLKVEDAKDKGIDTLASFKEELRNYRHQATPRYMTDTMAENQLVEETYHNMLIDRQVRHIAIRCQLNENDSAVAVARGKIEVARERVTTGIATTVGKGRNRRIVRTPEDFATVALEMSDDPSVKNNNGLVGWVTPFHFVYPFEKATYETPVGEVSPIFRTPFGFHILKVENELPHKEVNAAHIMKRVVLSQNKDAEQAAKENAEASAAAKTAIDSVYLIAKADDSNFAELAMKESDDRGTAQRGGNLGWFSRGQMVKEFEDVAFAMTKEGDVSEPFQTNFGWHIMKYYGQKGVEPLQDVKETIKKNIMRDERRDIVEQAFCDKLKTEYGFREDPSAIVAFHEAITGSNLADSVFLERISLLHNFMFAIGEEVFTQDDFAEYIKKNTWSQYGSMHEALNEKYNMFKNQKLRDTEDKHLEEKYPELHNLMKEYHDGILLFDVSLNEVWDKAGQDTAGLRRYFDEHKAQYKWETPRFKGMILRAKTKQALNAAKSIIKNFPADTIDRVIAQRINADSLQFVSCEKGLWAQGENPIVDRYGFKQKKVEVAADTIFPFVEVVGKKLKGAEEYQDERGKVVGDYQNYLETEWLKRLHDKYEVVVDTSVFEKVKATL